MKTKLSNRAANALSRTNSKSGALRALVVFAAQNPGFEWANYSTGNWAESARAYRGDARPVSRQWQKLLALLWACDDVTDADMIAASNRAFSGRLQFKKSTFCTHCDKIVNDEGHNTTCPKCVRQDGVFHRWAVDYCTGQYWPTEYRLASVTVLETAVRIMRARHDAANALEPTQ